LDFDKVNKSEELFMESFKENLIILIPLVFMALSTVINLLFYFSSISKIFVQYAFMPVILCGIVINTLTLKAQKNNSNKFVPKKRSPLAKFIVVVISLSWIISYGMATFMK